MNNSISNRRSLAVTGIRGIPAAHGGFETFAERLSVYLVAQGWCVTVYCQEFGKGAIYEDEWQGVRRVHIPVSRQGAWSTIIFDWKAIRHAVSERRKVLTLGYNTGVFNLLFRFAGIANFINMDGFEWKRRKWRWYQRLWLWVNEKAACVSGTHLIADHPEIGAYLESIVNRERISVIPYGADEVVGGKTAWLEVMELSPFGYSCLIARPEPENSILEIVQAFSLKKRDHKLLVFGNFDPANVYHRTVKAAASEEVLFVGAIYDVELVATIRYHSLLYFHGHQVGGTNPSLVEALGSGCACIAHENKFNRWVAADAAEYFSEGRGLSQTIEMLLQTPEKVKRMQVAARRRHRESFLWADVLSSYESLLCR